jgi:selenocysteine lyase/cysteine desulfurase
MYTLPSQRSLFDVPDDVAYFNCAYNSPLLNGSRQRLQQGVNFKSQPWQKTADSFFADAETIRHLAASTLGGDSEAYAVIPAASYGLSTAARAIEPSFRKGDRIVLIEEEFPSNVLPWRRSAQETGAEIVTVSWPEDNDWGTAIASRIEPRTKVAAVSTCHWTNGSLINLEPVAEACRKHGACLVVDATQTLGAVPFSFEKIQPDFLVAAGYKWLLCPYGFGLLYVAEHWHKARPLEEVWLARTQAQDFAGLVNYSDHYMPGARRFEMGEKCSATLLPGAIAALEQIRDWGVTTIAATLAGINGRISEELERLRFKLPPSTQRCPHMFGALLPESIKGNLVAKLQQQHIYISQRGKSVRFAPHLHVNENDLGRLFEAMRSLTDRVSA